jgi:hypothetical protein
LRQFERAAEEIQKDAGKLPAWMPILQQYAPSLLEDAKDALDLAQNMVAGWLERYMLAGEMEAGESARRIAKYFAGRDEAEPIGSHSRPIGIDRARQIGLMVQDLRDTPELRDAVRELHHAVNICFAETGAYKIVENQNGQAFVRSMNLQIGAPVGGAAPPPKKPPPSPKKRHR